MLSQPRTPSVAATLYPQVISRTHFEGLHISEINNGFPESSGVYLLLSNNNKVLYVGMTESNLREEALQSLKRKNKSKECSFNPGDDVEFASWYLTRPDQARELELEWIHLYQPRNNCQDLGNVLRHLNAVGYERDLIERQQLEGK